MKRSGSILALLFLLSACRERNECRVTWASPAGASGQGAWMPRKQAEESAERLNLEYETEGIRHSVECRTQ